MKKYIYAGYDKVAEMFNSPMVEVNDATAIRGFTQALNENVNKNDYELYRLGTFTDHDGKVVQSDTEPKKIYTGFDIKTE